MEVVRQPYILNLQDRGYIQGVTLALRDTGVPLCHYFGGIPYAQPPARWKRARALAPCYRYGTRVKPGRFTGGTGVCPQLRFGKGLEKEKVWSEDCLQLNIWVPAGEPPKKGWPVFFYIHGGFLQFGDANGVNLTALLSETNCRFVAVLPAYRLNLFGFLASTELLEEDSGGNLGFWDQRLAIEWTYQNITYFGGNAGNITIGGYSAGAHSAFYQLAHDLSLPLSKSVIRRAVMWSNSSGPPPKFLQSAQEQFDEFLTKLSIPLSLSSSEKLRRLRSMTPADLLRPTLSMALHQFRATTLVGDGFAPPNLFPSIQSGEFAARMRERNVMLLIGECSAEYYIYGLHRPPLSAGPTALKARLLADYHPAAVDALMRLYFPSGKLPGSFGDGSGPPVRNWTEAFARIYADVQIHALQRGLLSQIALNGCEDLVYRYRIEWRAGCAKTPRKWGATHTADMALWFWGNGGALSDKEKDDARKSFMDPFRAFLGGDEGLRSQWSVKEIKGQRCLRADGRVETVQDERWDWGVKVWDEVIKAVVEEPSTDRISRTMKAKL